MARRKLKLTPFARFLLFILFAAPIAYLIASYYNGQDGIQNVKDALGIEKDTPAETVAPAPVDASREVVSLDCEALASEIKALKAQIEELRADNLKYMEEVRQLKDSLATGANASDNREQ